MCALSSPARLVVRRVAPRRHDDVDLKPPRQAALELDADAEADQGRCEQCTALGVYRGIEVPARQVRHIATASHPCCSGRRWA